VEFILFSGAECCFCPPSEFRFFFSFPISFPIDRRLGVPGVLSHVFHLCFSLFFFGIARVDVGPRFGKSSPFNFLTEFFSFISPFDALGMKLFPSPPLSQKYSCFLFFPWRRVKVGRSGLSRFPPPFAPPLGKNPPPPSPRGSLKTFLLSYQT